MRGPQRNRGWRACFVGHNGMDIINKRPHLLSGPSCLVFVLIVSVHTLIRFVVRCLVSGCGSLHWRVSDSSYLESRKWAFCEWPWYAPCLYDVEGRFWWAGSCLCLGHSFGTVSVARRGHLYCRFHSLQIFRSYFLLSIYFAWFWALLVFNIFRPRWQLVPLGFCLRVSFSRAVVRALYSFLAFYS